MSSVNLTRKKQKWCKIRKFRNKWCKIKKHSRERVRPANLQISARKQRRRNITSSITNIDTSEIVSRHWCKIIRICQIERFHRTERIPGNLEQRPQLAARAHRVPRRLEGQFSVELEHLPQVVPRVIHPVQLRARPHRQSLEYCQTIFILIHLIVRHRGHLLKSALQHRRRLGQICHWKPPDGVPRHQLVPRDDRQVEETDLGLGPGPGLQPRQHGQGDLLHLQAVQQVLERGLPHALARPQLRLLLPRRTAQLELDRQRRGVGGVEAEARPEAVDAVPQPREWAVRTVFLQPAALQQLLDRQQGQPVLRQLRDGLGQWGRLRGPGCAGGSQRQSGVHRFKQFDLIKCQDKSWKCNCWFQYNSYAK